MSDPTTTRRAAPSKREIRDMRTQSARAALASVQPGQELLVLTYGQFSLADGLSALLQQTGPAVLNITTWTVVQTEIARVGRWVEEGLVTRARFLLDRGLERFQPQYLAELRRLFGDDAIRTTQTHAKFATIRNADWNLALRTSMNLNANPRTELMEISDDPRLAAFLDAFVDESYAAQPPGVFNGGLRPTPANHGVSQLGSVTL